MFPDTFIELGMPGVGLDRAHPGAKTLFMFILLPYLHKAIV